MTRPGSEPAVPGSVITANPAICTARALAHALGDGCEHVVISPGSRSTPLALAFDAEPGTETHVVLDERAAGFVALGLALASGKPAALLCTSGSAGAHYFPAVLEAEAARVPMVVLTADRPAELHGVGANQTVEQRDLFGSHVRFSAHVPAGEVNERWIGALAGRALDAATGVTAGPAHLNVAFREPLWHPGPESVPALEPVVRGARETPRLSSASLRGLGAELAMHPRGLLVLGPRAAARATDAQRLAQAAARLSTALGWPVLADPASGLRHGGAVADLVSTYDALLRGARFAEAHAPTAIVQVGQAPTSKSLGTFIEATEPALHVAIDPAGQWNDPGCTLTGILAADPSQVLHDLADHLGTHTAKLSAPWKQAWLNADRAARVSIDRGTAEGAWEGRVTRALLDALPSPSRLHIANSMPIRDMDSFGLANGKDIAVHANRGVSGIDGALSTAMGEALADPATPTALLLGDLSLLHDLDGLLASATLGVNLTAVVINNDGGGIFEHLPIARHPSAFERLFVAPQPVALAPLCAATGARHGFIADLGDLSIAVADALRRDGLDVIEVAIDRQENLARRAQAWRQVAEALPAAARGQST